jgi:hypothetical protein
VVKNKVKGEKACNKVTDTAREWVEKGYEAAGPFSRAAISKLQGEQSARNVERLERQA